MAYVPSSCREDVELARALCRRAAMSRYGACSRALSPSCHVASLSTFHLCGLCAVVDALPHASFFFEVFRVLSLCMLLS